MDIMERIFGKRKKISELAAKASLREHLPRKKTVSFRYCPNYQFGHFFLDVKNNILACIDDYDNDGRDNCTVGDFGAKNDQKVYT